jgi:hypothetical protein
MSINFEAGTIVFYDEGLHNGLDKGDNKVLAIVFSIDEGVFTIKYLNESDEVST